eukprot:m.14344 g.14344  ORF g.14344 m.14344 type:complete len:383 (-) comp3144_c0_seq2:2199-3347(-)
MLPALARTSSASPRTAPRHTVVQAAVKGPLASATSVATTTSLHESSHAITTATLAQAPTVAAAATPLHGGSNTGTTTSTHGCVNTRTHPPQSICTDESVVADKSAPVVDCVLECVELDAIVAVGEAVDGAGVAWGPAGPSPPPDEGSGKDNADARTDPLTASISALTLLNKSSDTATRAPPPSGRRTASQPIPIPAARQSLRPGIDVLSPEAVWNHQATPTASRGGRESFDAHALRVAELTTRGPARSPPSDCGELLFSLTYHISIPLPEPIRLAMLPSSHRFLIELQCRKRAPLDTEHVLRFSTPEIGWISDPDDPELCIWLSSTCYIARQSAAEPFVVVELVLHRDGYTTERVATAIGLPCVPASDILFGAPKWRATSMP